MGAADRDEEFAQFVASRQGPLLRFAYALCGDWHRAEDVLQTALTKLYLAWPRLHRDGREEAYARRIILHADVDERRRPWRRERPGLDGLDRPAPPGGAGEDRSELVGALLRLPRMQRQVVVLRHWMDLSVADTATELGISEGTVKSHASRGLAALQALLTPFEA